MEEHLTDKPAFNRELLEKRIEELNQMHTVEPTQQFVDEEYKRCEDPRYFYNTYYTIDGKAVKPISEEEWKQRFDYITSLRSRVQQRDYPRPYTPDECVKVAAKTDLRFTSPEVSDTKPPEQL